MNFVIFLVCLFREGNRVLRPSLIPEPLSLVVNEGYWTLKPNSKIYFDSAITDCLEVAQYFEKIARVSTGYALQLSDDKEKADIVFLQKSNNKNNKNNNINNNNKEINSKINEFEIIEEYEMEVTKDKVRITAETKDGIFYGVVTLLQLLPPQILAKSTQHNVEWKCQCVSIKDKPYMKWRSILLDTSRHFFTVPTIKRFIDQMAFHKINTFHWHLNDDNGWRLEIKKHPKLIELGSTSAYRPKPWDRYSNDSVKYGPYFYTQEEVKDIVKYAHQRSVIVVPEIEMPAHTIGALSAYPELSCLGGPFEPFSDFKGTPDIFCAGNDKTFEFLRDVIDEVLPLFPKTEYIHLGGDEANKARWKECPKCQKRIKDEKLTDVNQLQSWFMKQMVSYVQSKGRKAIGWDEILTGGLADGAAVMNWHGSSLAQKAASQGHNVVMATEAVLYLDHPQFPVNDTFQFFKGLNTLHQIWAFNPLDGIEEKYQKYIIGVQISDWSEFIWGDEYDLDYKTYPRGSALASLGWEMPEKRSWYQFLDSLTRGQMERYRQLRIFSSPISSVSQRIFWNPEMLRKKQTTRKDTNDDFVTVTWAINNAVGTEGNYEVAFVFLKGENKIHIKNVKILIDDVVVSESTQEGESSWEETKTNIFKLPTKVTGVDKEIKLQADIAGVDGTESYGEVHVYFT